MLLDRILVFLVPTRCVGTSANAATKPMKKPSRVCGGFFFAAHANLTACAPKRKCLGAHPTRLTVVCWGES
jgi:hypothetical protein